MIQTAVACFVGCFAMVLTLGEVVGLWWPPARPPGRWLRYLAALLLGVLVTVVLSWALQWAAGVFAHVAH